MLTETKSTTEKRLIEIDILRGFAMLAVVAIHVTNLPLQNLAEKSGHLFFYMVSSFLNFAVPVFVLISALMAAYSEDLRPTPLWPYYKKKLIRLFVPYLAWSLFYLAFRFVTHGLFLEDILSWRNWVAWILQGRAYEHLYFLAVICQFHVLFPLLFRLARLVKDKPFWAFFIAVGGQHIVYWVNRLWVYRVFPYFHASFFGYFGIVFLGLYLGLNYDKACRWLRKYAKWLALFCLASAVAFLYYNCLLYKEIKFHSYPYSFIRLFYVASLPLCLLAPALSLRLQQGWSGRGLVWVGSYTLGIYLAHPVLNFILRRYVKTDNLLLLALICIAAIFAFTVVCGYITKFLQRYRLTAWIFGTKATRIQ